MRVLRHAVLALVVLGTADAIAQQEPYKEHADFWRFLGNQATVRACVRGSADLTAAQDRLRQFRRFVRESPDDADIAGPRGRLHALLKTPCFQLAVENPRLPWPDSVPSLKTWSANGGDLWLVSLLELPQFGTVPDLKPHVVVPPDALRTLVPGRSDHPNELDAWLCAPIDAVCGARTSGWKARAVRALKEHWDRSKTRDAFGLPDHRPPNTPDRTSANCQTEAEGDDSGARYEAWRACVEQSRSVRPMVPHAEFKMPDAGWLVVAGRRGHYDFCDTVHAFDLRTGEAVFDASCSALALESDGSVNRATTNARRKHQTRMGTVSVDDLREAAWMLLFRAQFVEGQPQSDEFPMPAEWPRAWRTRFSPWSFSMRGMGGSWNSSQTALTWTLMVDGRMPLAGRLTWPDSSNGAEAHATSLLIVAEASLVEQCVNGRPPAMSPARFTILDEYADRDDVVGLAEDLKEAAAERAAPRPCR